MRTRTLRYSGRAIAAVVVSSVLSLSVTAARPVSARASVHPAVLPAGAVLPGVGVNFHGMWTDRTQAQNFALLNRLAAAHVGWIRMDIGWASLQENGPNGVSKWAVNLLDKLVNAARARGIQVLGLLWATPGWANGGRDIATPPRNPAAYGRIARWAAAHFRGRVAAWEVWNEPNQESFFHGSAAQYVRLLKASYRQFKAGDPRAKVVLGGPAYNDTNWLRAAYRAGAHGHFDVMATHPYQGKANLPPETPDATGGNIWLMDHVKAVHALMRKHHDGSKPIWFTEFGWSSHRNSPGIPDWELGVTPRQQGSYFTRAVSYMAVHYPYVTNMFWYDDRDDSSGTVQVDNYGLMKRNLSAKPVYGMLRHYLAANGVDGSGGARAGVFYSRGASRHLECTIVGTKHPDVLMGTSGRDVICGGEGADVIHSRGGDDVIYGGDGSDRMSGGSGNDTIYGGNGIDVMVGGIGSDWLHGDNGTDVLSGGPGNDVLRGDRDADRMRGGLGQDILVLGKGKDRARGGDGADRIRSRDGIRDKDDGGPGPDLCQADKNDLTPSC